MNGGEYHKIHTVFKRDPATKYKTLLDEFSMPEFDYLSLHRWIFTEMVDGTNIRITVNKENTSNPISFGGRTNKTQIPAPLFNALQAQFMPLAGRLTEAFPNGATLYGEGFGPGIQKGGRNYRSDCGFVMFDVNINGVWLQRESVVEISDRFSIQSVPVIGKGTLGFMADLVRDRFRSKWGEFQAEGIVARPEVELLDRFGSRIITKLKCSDFLD